MKVQDFLLVIGFNSEETEKICLMLNNFLLYLIKILNVGIKLVNSSLFKVPYSSLTLKPY